jgi:hypothetical protein
MESKKSYSTDFTIPEGIGNITKRIQEIENESPGIYQFNYEYQTLLHEVHKFNRDIDRQMWKRRHMKRS